MLAFKNTRDKYLKNKKSNKNQDLETEEAKRGSKMSTNIAKISKATRIFHDNEEMIVAVNAIYAIA